VASEDSHFGQAGTVIRLKSKQSQQKATSVKQTYTYLANNQALGDITMLLHCRKWQILNKQQHNFSFAVRNHRAAG
jgi:hypothetical protein